MTKSYLQYSVIVICENPINDLYGNWGLPFSTYAPRVRGWGSGLLYNFIAIAYYMQ